MNNKINREKLNNLDSTITTVEEFVDYQTNTVNRYMFDNIDDLKINKEMIEHKLKYIYSDIAKLEAKVKRLENFIIYGLGTLAILTLFNVLNNVFNWF